MRKYKRVSGRLDEKGLYIEERDFDIMEAILSKMPDNESEFYDEMMK